METEQLKATLYLQTVLATLEDIIENDETASKLVAGWNNVVQFRVAGADIGTQLVFQQGKLTAIPGVVRKPTVELSFATPADVIATFGGGGEKKRPKLRGLWHYGILKKLPMLLKIMSQYMRPKDELLANPDKKALLAKMLLNMIGRATVLVATHDAEASKALVGIPEGLLEWKILPDGPTLHIESLGGAVSFNKGPAPRDADARLKFKDADAALGFLSGRIEFMKAITTGAVNVEGKNMMLAQRMFLPMSTVGKLMSTTKKKDGEGKSQPAKS